MSFLRNPDDKTLMCIADAYTRAINTLRNNGLSERAELDLAVLILGGVAGYGSDKDIDEVMLAVGEAVKSLAVTIRKHAKDG